MPTLSPIRLIRDVKVPLLRTCNSTWDVRVASVVSENFESIRKIPRPAVVLEAADWLKTTRLLVEKGAVFSITVRKIEVFSTTCSRTLGAAVPMPNRPATLLDSVAVTARGRLSSNPPDTEFQKIALHAQCIGRGSFQKTNTFSAQ